MNKTKLKSSKNSIDKILFLILLKEPFYAHIFQLFTRQITDTIPTAAVTLKNGRVILLLNPSFFDSLNNDNERIGLIKHEILHVILGHLNRVVRKETDATIYNIAADLVVNQLIPPQQLPDGALLISSLPKLKLASNKNINYYIQKLETTFEKKQYTLLLDNSHSNHSLWTTNDASENILNQNSIKVIVQKAINNAKKAGQLPQKIEEIVNYNKNISSKYNWRKQLRLFTTKTEVSNIRFTNFKKSKRFNSYPGVKLKRSLSLLVAIDTSGSISNKDLEIFLNEIQSLSNQTRFIAIIECDCEIKDVYKYKFSKDRVITGRGGTEFDPVLSYFNDKIELYDGLIYFTDGYASQPKIIPKRNCLFVLNNTSHKLIQKRNIYLTQFNDE
jgi:predicted metal-dependent peptidase